jgi:hypothetical protein
MTGVREFCIAAPLATLTICQPVLGRDSLDLNEADARDAAYTIMRAAEERFDCELEEHSVRDVGNEPDLRYLFYLSAKGDECHEAMIFLANMANQDDKVIFRQVDESREQLEQIGDPVIFDDQILIHEVDPEIDNNENPEE